MNNRTHYFTWHLSCWWSWRCFRKPYERDYYLDGGSVEWRFGPLVVEKRVHWLS